MGFIPLNEIAWLAAFAGFAAVLFASGILPLMFLAARRRAVVTSRSAWERMAAQLTYPMCISALFLVLLGGASLVLAGNPTMQAPSLRVFSHFAGELSLFGSVGLAAGFLCFVARLFIRRGIVPTLAAAISFVGTWIAFFGWLLILFGVLFNDFFPNLFVPGELARTVIDWPAWWTLVMLWTVCASSAMAGGLGLITQILRRESDDYGRDYYMLAARWCARWARWGALGSTLTAAIWAWQLYPVPGRVWIYAAAASFLSLVSMLVWNVVVSAENPLRYKFLMIIGSLSMIMCFGAAGGLWRAGRILIGQP